MAEESAGLFKMNASVLSVYPLKVVLNSKS